MELSTAPLVSRVLELAERLGYPSMTVEAELVIPAGGAAWETWCASAERVPLARVLGVLVVQVHRTVRAP